jgi:hypothetical protein
MPVTAWPWRLNAAAIFPRCADPDEKSSFACEERPDAHVPTDARKMKISLSRSTLLTFFAVAILLAALPAAIRRLIQTGSPYLFTRDFFDDILARFSGAGRFRFIVQPTVALVIGVRDGIKDGRAGHLPFVLALMSRSARKCDLLRSAFASVRELISIAIILDVVSQFLIFRRIHPGAALLVGPILIAIPYAVSRALATSLSRKRSRSAQVGSHITRP